jgi:hypothetical protein
MLEVFSLRDEKIPMKIIFSFFQSDSIKSEVRERAEEEEKKKSIE